MELRDSIDGLNPILSRTLNWGERVNNVTQSRFGRAGEFVIRRSRKGELSEEDQRIAPRVPRRDSLFDRILGDLNQSTQHFA